MARPKLRIGERGEIRARKIGDRKWLAKCSYRDSWGKKRDLSARGATKAAATNAVKDKWLEKSKSIVFRSDASQEVTINDVAKKYFEHLVKDNGPKKPLIETIDQNRNLYRNHIEGNIGKLTFDEVTTGMLREYLADFIDPDGNGAGTAIRVRVLLVSVFTYAQERDIVRHNPVKGTPSTIYRAPIPEIWTPETIENIRTSLRLWMQQVRHRSQHLLDIFDMSLATGCRISEVLGFTWEATCMSDDPNEPVRIMVNLAVVPRKGKANTLSETKTKDEKLLTLPAFGADVLRRRMPENPTGLIFPSRNGRPLHYSAIYKATRQALQWGKEHLNLEVPDSMTFHKARKTALTYVARAHGVEAAARQAGHRSSDITLRHYVESQSVQLVDNADALDLLGSTSNQTPTASPE